MHIYDLDELKNWLENRKGKNIIVATNVTDAQQLQKALSQYHIKAVVVAEVATNTPTQTIVFSGKDQASVDALSFMQEEQHAISPTAKLGGANLITSLINQMPTNFMVSQFIEEAKQAGFVVV